MSCVLLLFYWEVTEGFFSVGSGGEIYSCVDAALLAVFLIHYGRNPRKKTVFPKFSKTHKISAQNKRS